MPYKGMIWTLAAVLLVGVIATVDIVRERQNNGPVFVGGSGPVSEEQVRTKITADGWSNILISREGRYIQVMGSKDQLVRHLTIDSQNGRVMVGEDDD